MKKDKRTTRGTRYRKCSKKKQRSKKDRKIQLGHERKICLDYFQNGIQQPSDIKASKNLLIKRNTEEYSLYIQTNSRTRKKHALEKRKKRMPRETLDRVTHTNNTIQMTITGIVGLQIIYTNTDGLVANSKELEVGDWLGATKTNIIWTVEMKVTKKYIRKYNFPWRIQNSMEGKRRQRRRWFSTNGKR